MGVSDNLRCLTNIVQRLEDGGASVAGVQTETGNDGLSGDLSLEIGFLPVGIAADDVSLQVESAEIGDDGRVTFDVSFRVDGDLAESSTPPYKNPERLREVYDAYDTFPAMKEALGVDVTPKTVRNHMVKHGIHDPESEKANADATAPATPEGYDEADRADDSRGDGGDTANDDPRMSDDGDDAAPQSDSATPDGAGSDGGVEADGETVLSDGLGLPEDVTLEEVKKSVRSAGSMTEFRRSLDLEHEQARLVLENLNLIDLIYGRVARGPNRDVSMEAVETRIRSAIGNTA